MWQFIDQVVRASPADQAQEARIVAGALWVLLACTVGVYVVNLIAEPNLPTLLGYVPSFVGIGAAVAFARRGHIGVAAHVLVGMCAAGLLGAAVFTGGMAGGAPHVVGLLVVLGAVVLPMRSAGGLLLLVVGALLGLAAADERLHALQVVDPEPSRVVIGAVANAVFLMVVVRFLRFLHLDSITKLEAQGQQLDRALHELEQTSVSKAHLDDVLGAVRDLILVTDRSGVVVDANPAAQEVFETALVGQPLDALLLDGTHILSSDGRRVPVRVSRGALAGDARSGSGFVYVLSDITVEQEAIEAIRRAHAEAESANQAKSRFLAHMSHELRTPLNAIIGYAELLEDDLSDAQGVEDLRRIHRSGRDLLHLINDVLDLSKVEAGKMELHLECVEIQPLVDDVLGTVRPRFARKGLALDVAGTPGGAVQVDGQKLRQILLNLLSNAAKFTQRGGAELAMARYDRDGTQWLRFTVTDSGIGIGRDQQRRIFEPFSQVEEERTRAYEGTGLGLSISRAFARMMGGEIHVESELGKGSSFRVDLPAVGA